MKPLSIELAAQAPKTIDSARRVIEGSIMAHDAIGVALVDGEAREVRFRAGSLAVPADRRVPLVSEHDVGAPVGVLAGELVAGDGVTEAIFSIDKTPAGDDALVQAASGSRSGLSAGAVATEWKEDADGVLDVTAALLFHVGHVTIPAFAGAQVSRVAASRAKSPPTERSSTMSEQEIRDLTDKIGETSDEELAELLEHDEEAVRTAAEAEKARRTEAAASKDAKQGTLATESRSAEKPVVLNRRAKPHELKCSAGELVLHMIRAEKGDRESHRVVQAVLATIDSTDVPGLMPKAYSSSALETIAQERPLWDDVVVSPPMPDVGMAFQKPNWVTKPNGGWVAELADIPSNAPEIGTEDVAILEWAYGVAMSYAVATRSSPDAIESIYRAAVEDYYSDVEQKIADLLMANDTAGAAGAGIGAAIAAHFAATKKRPNRLVVAPDIYGDLVDVIDSVPTYSSGDVSGAELTGTIAGLQIVVSAHLPAGAELVLRKGVIDARETNPVRLTANVIGALKVELGVTSFASFDLEYAGGIQSLTPAAGAPAGASEAKRTARKRTSSSDKKGS